VENQKKLEKIVENLGKLVENLGKFVEVNISFGVYSIVIYTDESYFYENLVQPWVECC
jgi:hypothetical protein